MKFLLAIFFILTYWESHSQKIKGPVWSQKNIYFEMAKIKTLDNKTSKYGPESFKTSKVTLENAETDYCSMTIDIPDKVYLKHATTFSVTYKLSEESEYITYSLTNENVMCMVSFFLKNMPKHPMKF